MSSGKLVYRQTLPPGVKQRKLPIIRPSCFHLGRIWRHQEASRKCESEGRSTVSTLCYPMDYKVRGILQTRILEWAAFPSPGYLPNPAIETRSPALQADSLPAETQGKPKNTGVGSLSLLQGTSQGSSLEPGTSQELGCALESNWHHCSTQAPSSVLARATCSWLIDALREGVTL